MIRGAQGNEIALRIVCQAKRVLSGTTGPDHFMPNTKWTATRNICVAFVAHPDFMDLRHAND